MMPVIQQQGGSIDLARLTELHSEMLNIPRLKDIVQFQPVSQPAQDLGAIRPSPSQQQQMPPAQAGAGVPDASQWMDED